MLCMEKKYTFAPAKKGKNTITFFINLKNKNKDKQE